MPDARFSSAERELVEEDSLRLVSVGVDIGSATSHLVFSRLELEREDNRYVVVRRAVLAESDILLTPYLVGNTIDGEALERFVERQYAAAGLRRQDVDTGALILTGVALLRDNARQIAELFAEEAGRFVAVSAGDNLEALMAAHGSGALERSLSDPRRIANVDIGGGTTKIALCAGGHAVSLAAVDVGARLVVRDAETDRIVRLEPAGQLAGRAIGLDLIEGGRLSDADMAKLAGYLADGLLGVLQGGPSGEAEQALLRTPPLDVSQPPEALVFSGGVAEFIYGRELHQFGDLGPVLAEQVRRRVECAGLPILTPTAGIRATVIGASQYTVQVSGSTIFVAPAEVLPVRNVPAIRARLALDQDVLEAECVAADVGEALRRLDLHAGETPVALAVRWAGSATFRRIDAFCRGVVDGLREVLARGHPLVLVFDGDVGGLFGIHLRETLGLPNPVVSIDGVELTDFNYVDIGELIPSSGAVPVVIKSLVFRGGTHARVARANG